MSGAKIRFEEAVEDFRAWAAKYSIAKRSSYWECDYDRWPVVYTAFKEFLQSSEPKQWDRPSIESMLYVLARDNEMEALKDDLIEHAKHLLALAEAGLHSTEQDARWQLADALGAVQADDEDVLPALEAYAADSDEYVSRRALLALGRRRSPVAEALACRAWDTGHEYQRIAALEALSDIDSPLLFSYLDLALEDGRQYVINAAVRIRSGK